MCRVVCEPLRYKRSSSVAISDDDADVLCVGTEVFFGDISNPAQVSSSFPPFSAASGCFLPV